MPDLFAVSNLADAGSETKEANGLINLHEMVLTYILHTRFYTSLWRHLIPVS